MKFINNFLCTNKIIIYGSIALFLGSPLNLTLFENFVHTYLMQKITFTTPKTNYCEGEESWVV
jgi:hypothetical protein